MANRLSQKSIIIMVVAVAIVVIMLLWTVLAYNSVVSQEQDINDASSEIKNRYTTKVTILSEMLVQLNAYGDYEISLLTNLTALQTQWQTAIADHESDETLINISTQIDANFLMLSTWTNYPYVGMLDLVQGYMGETVDLNEQLSYKRSVYNDEVRDYNSAIKSFPMMMFAGSFGFEERPYWGSTDSTDPTTL
jgi:LemA protein